MMLVFLVSVAAATTTLETDRAVAATLDDTSSPVQKVVKLLTDMQTTLQEEEAKDEDAYEKFTCWCQNTDKEKVQAIADAENAIIDLEAEIERREKKAEKLGGGIKSSEADLATAQQSLDGAEAQRTKDAAKNHEEMVALTKNIASLKGAIIVLKKHQATAFPQLHLNFLQQVQPVDKLTAWMDQHSFHALSNTDEAKVEKTVQHYMASSAPTGYSHEELVMLVKAQGLVRSFVQQAAAVTPKYENQSGEIFGILTQLKEQLEADLKETEEKDATQASDSAQMGSSLKEQISNAEKMAAGQSGEAADNSKALADAKEELEDTQKSLTADQAFLEELRATCEKMDVEWQERRVTRKDEILAISEAIDMLMDDDARGNMSSTFGGGSGSFVQLEIEDVRAKASAVLKRAGRKAHDELLVQLAATVKLDAFTKVKQAIKDMVAALKQQQEDEVKHKDFCQAELQKNEMETTAKENDMEDLQNLIATLENTIETLGKEIKTAEGELQDMKLSAQRAAENRIAESKEFQQAVAEQRATRAILAKVKGRLNKFYQSQALLQQTPQEEAYKKTHVVVPHGATAGEYKKNAGAGGVITMLDNLITDAMKLETESIKGENDATEQYNTFTADNNAAMGAKESEIVNKSQLKAQAETDHEQAQADLKAALEDLEALHKYNGDVHKSCDFVLKNFDARQTARREEIDALQQASAILSGSSEGF